MTDLFTYRVSWSPEDQEHVGLCAEFPSLSWFAPTPEQALAGIRRLVAEVVNDLRDSGEPVPEPFAARNYSGEFKVRIPPQLHRELVIAAAEAGVSLNRLASLRLAGRL
jgi:predicted HicB family RNase H-like nuclease